MWIGYATTLGEAWIAWEQGRLVRLGLPGTAPPAGVPAADPPEWVENLASLLAAWFDGSGPLPELPGHIELPPTTPFRDAVRRAVRAIPAGETRTYGEIAESVGRPGSARAVGATMADNPIAPLVPCHRVVGSDGGLRGYAGGIDMKRRLIDMEAAHAR